MATSPSAQKDVQAKFEQIVQDFFLKGVQIILLSRMPLNGKSAAKSPPQASPREGTRDRRFNLALGECPAALDGLEVCNAKGFRSVVVDVLLVRLKRWQAEPGASSGSKEGEVDGTRRSVCSQQEYCKNILERWELQFACRDEERGVGKQTLGTGEIPVVYKSIMILLRSLCCMTRLLPAYRLSQLASCSSYGNYFGITFRVSPLPHPLSYTEGGQMSSYKFAPIEVPSGKICLSVKFRAIVVSDLKGPSEVRLPSIMKNYIGSSTTNPVKKLHDHGSTSLMLNFGGYIPLTVNIPPSLPHDTCRGERLRCSTFISPNCGHSCPREPLQKSLFRRRSSGCINFSLEHASDDAQFARQRKSTVGSVSASKAGTTVSRACNIDCGETGIDDFSLPFAVDNSKTGKRRNSCPSSQNPLEACERMAKEGAIFQISQEAAVGALVQLLKFAPPLQQATAPMKPHDSSNSPKPSAQEGSGGNFCNYRNKPETFRIPKKDAHFQMSYSEQKEETSSYHKKTAAQALKELDSYKDIKRWLLDQGKGKVAEN